MSYINSQNEWAYLTAQHDCRLAHRQESMVASTNKILPYFVYPSLIINLFIVCDTLAIPHPGVGVWSEKP